ncbi:MAG: O-antigen ligase family protein [Ruminococcaceae bacterium]|nr:O-antigen ligase family protein [Oscillospiraceae bacterium]
MLPNLDTPIEVQDHGIAKLRAHPVCRAIDRFLRSPAYFPVVGIMTVASVAWSLELVLYTCFILIGLFVTLLGKDLLPLTPLAVLSYISPSLKNNPGANGDSVFSGGSGVYILVIAGLFAVSLVVRLCTDPKIGQRAFLTCKRSLMTGMLVLGIAYMLAGAFTKYYTANGWRNALFGFMQFASVFLFYYLFTGGIQWDEVPKNYLAWSGVCIGGVILGQILHIYILNDVIEGGRIMRERIYSGWGTCNNVGAMLAVTIPFVFQMANNSKRTWIYEIVALIFLGGVILTLSRASILGAVGIYVICYGVLFHRKRISRTGWVIRLGIVAAALLAAFLLLYEQIQHFFAALIARGWSSDDRMEIYVEGIKQFLRMPVFGGSFFPTEYVPFQFSSQAAFSGIFPPRWHNTVVQLLASCGIVGLAAYGFHRYQTVKMILRKPVGDKVFIALSILVLLGTSMLDCHIFNVGPTLLYSIALAFAEKAVRT